MITEEFKRAFMLVVTHYGCSQAEQNLMKGLAKAKYHDAEPSFLAMAREINPAFGINDRIKNSDRVDASVMENLRLDGMSAYERATEQLALMKVRKNVRVK